MIDIDPSSPILTELIQFLGVKPNPVTWPQVVPPVQAYMLFDEFTITSLLPDAAANVSASARARMQVHVVPVH
jgi:hypothetical protein